MPRRRLERPHRCLTGVGGNLERARSSSPRNGRELLCAPRLGCDVTKVLADLPPLALGVSDHGLAQSPGLVGRLGHHRATGGHGALACRVNAVDEHERDAVDGAEARALDTHRHYLAAALELGVAQVAAGRGRREALSVRARIDTAGPFPSVAGEEEVQLLARVAHDAHGAIDQLGCALARDL